MRKTGLVFVAAIVAAGPAPAATNPGVVAQGLLLRRTMEGYAERDAARLNGRRAPQARSGGVSPETCRDGWRLFDRMTPSQRRMPQQACPR